MISTIKLGDIDVDVTQKNIKNVHLSVYPPNGRVRISAPLHMSPETIRVFAISKLAWIMQEQQKLRNQERETSRDYVDRESHYVWGERYLLKVLEVNAAPCVELKHRNIILKVRHKNSRAKKQEVMAQWYRSIVKDSATKLIAKWEPLLGVKVSQIFVQQMKTKWGSCNTVAKNVRLNSELAKKPPECLEYIVVHEMAHLLEATHNQKFIKLMNHFMPAWRHYLEVLNSLPTSHERWSF